MTKLLVWRDKIRLIYRDYEALLRPLWKFFLSMTILIFMNQTLGYDKQLKNILLVVVVSLVAAFVPSPVFVLLMAVFSLLHVYAAASLLAVLVLAVFLVLFLLLERYTPSYSYIVVLMPFAMFFHMPLLPALLIGLIAEPVGIIASSCGVIVYFLFKSLRSTELLSGEVTLDNMMNIYQSVMDTFLHDKEMLLYLVALALVVLVVYFIRRMAIAQAFPAAILSGAVVFLMILLIGELVLKIDGAPGFLLAGSVLSTVLAVLIQFLLLPLDYSRTETVQFEDDDYYYYVKAVPKMQVAAPNNKVKRINAQKVTGNTMNLFETLQEVSEKEDER
jgi:hypothetical protein